MLPEGASPNAAAAAAAHLALVQLSPDQRMVLDAAYAGSLVLIPDGPRKTTGITVGEAVASRILTERASDGGARSSRRGMRSSPTTSGPVTAIRAADSDGNPDTLEDPSWTPLLVTPPFPDYIAGYTTYAGAAEKILEHVFGKHPRVVIMLTSPTAPGVVETYSTFRAIADGVVDARV